MYTKKPRVPVSAARIFSVQLIGLA